MRRVTGDGRSRYPRTVITKYMAGLPLRRLITRAGNNNDTRKGIGVWGREDGCEPLPTAVTFR